MYESEVNDKFESLDSLPAEIRKRFTEFREQITLRTVLPWGEHCTECNWPTCYSSCELYSPRKDGACRLFVDGMVRIDHREGLSPYVLKVRFKRWGKLWAAGRLTLHSLADAERKERVNIAVGAVSRRLPLPRAIRERVLRKVNYRRRASAEAASNSAQTPDYFLLECYNPNSRTIALTFTLRLREANSGRPFQTMLTLSPGFNRHKVLCSEIARVFDATGPFEVEITPNDCENTVLYFGLMDFVRAASVPAPAALHQAQSNPWKCIIWDLDNTLWDGTLVEDGPERIRIRQGVIDVIRRTDERGILHSIASKNNHDEAVTVLSRYGIADYFLFPQIGWRPKSQSVARIAQLLNIGIEAMAFVDDQEFERAEVKAAHPGISVLDSSRHAEIPTRPECLVPVTDESRRRRTMYQQQQQRETMLDAHNGDYLGFLRDCRIEMGITRLGDTNLERVYELAQRTNQMNFSGTRYPRAWLKEIAQDRNLRTYVMECADRFGSYGIVGFSVLDIREPRLLDLVFSCRIQGKRVEHAFLLFLLQRFLSGANTDFRANYKKTPKNAAAGRVFEDLGFEVEREQDGVLSLVFRRGRRIAGENIVAIKEAS